MWNKKVFIKGQGDGVPLRVWAEPLGRFSAKMEKSLRDFRPGERGVVAKVRAAGPVKRRLFDMGITPGAEILMRKTAPLGDPIEVTLRGYELSLRKSEAEVVLMETGG